jgi:hypothetical protein
MSALINVLLGEFLCGSAKTLCGLVDANSRRLIPGTFTAAIHRAFWIWLDVSKTNNQYADIWSKSRQNNTIGSQFGSLSNKFPGISFKIYKAESIIVTWFGENADKLNTDTANYTKCIDNWLISGTRSRRHTVGSRMQGTRVLQSAAKVPDADRIPLIDQ